MPNWYPAGSLTLEWLVGLNQFYESDKINVAFGGKLCLAGLPQTVPIFANLNMSAAVVNKLGKQRTTP